MSKELDIVKEIKSKKEYEIVKILFELLNDSILFRIAFFGDVTKKLLEAGGYNLDRPTKISEKDLLVKSDARYDMNPRDDYYLNMKNMYVTILAIGDTNGLYEDTNGLPYGDRILPATLKLGNHLFIADNENYDYYSRLYDHGDDMDIIERMKAELPFYSKSHDAKDSSDYNSFIHKVKIPYILESIKTYSCFKHTKEEVEKVLKLLNIIMEKYPEYNNDTNKKLQDDFECEIDEDVPFKDV